VAYLFLVRPTCRRVVISSHGSNSGFRLNDLARLRLTNRIGNCDGRETMTIDEYEKLPLEEKEHFTRRKNCGEMFDRRSLDEVLFHATDHKHRPDTQCSGSEKL
jgi:hypothetical protein